MTVVMFDLDGTLADNSHRTHLAAEKRWDEYHAACVDDIPLPGAIALLRLLGDRMPPGCLFIVTGRSDAVRLETENWIGEHIGVQFPMIMRHAGDHTPNVEWKHRQIKDFRYSARKYGLDPDVSILLIDDHPSALELSDVCDVLPVRSDWGTS